MPITSHTSADFYASPAIYDILHTPGTANEVTALERLARRFLSPPSPRRGSARRGEGRVGGRGQPVTTSHAAGPLPCRPLTILEPACGTGRYLRVLASRGHTVLGFDRDESMIAYASARLARSPQARVFRGDMRTFADRGHVKPRSIDLAFTPINSIRHLHSDRAMLNHFAQVARVLKPTGVYAVGLSITAYGLEDPSEDLWQGARGPCKVSQLVQYLPAPGGTGPGSRDEHVISHMTVRTPRHTRHIDSTYTLRAYDLAQWRRLISRSAFTIAATVDEDGDNLDLAPPGYAVFVLRPQA